MAEIKNRISMFDEAMKYFRSAGVMTVANVELACLQLRKIYELIGFSALAANKARYAEIRGRYEKDWNLPAILKEIESFNPNFLPVRFSDEDDETLGPIRQMVRADEFKFTRLNLTKFHGELGEVLHAQNPYKPMFDYRPWFQKCIERRDFIIKVLSNHAVEIVKDEVFYRITMTGSQGEIQVAVMVALANEEVA
jgi:hypothetical protein